MAAGFEHTIFIHFSTSRPWPGLCIDFDIPLQRRLAQSAYTCVHSYLAVQHTYKRRQWWAWMCLVSQRQGQLGQTAISTGAAAPKAGLVSCQLQVSSAAIMTQSQCCQSLMRTAKSNKANLGLFGKHHSAAAKPKTLNVIYALHHSLTCEAI